jgi:hypothetical protein
MEVYLFVVDGAEWEDIVVYISKEDAIAKSLKHPKIRLEIFSRGDDGGYRPTYSYFMNGKLFEYNGSP